MGLTGLSKMRVFEFMASDRKGRAVSVKMTVTHNLSEHVPRFIVERNGVMKSCGSYEFGLWADNEEIRSFEEMYTDEIMRVVERMKRAGETFRRAVEDSFDRLANLFV